MSDDELKMLIQVLGAQLAEGDEKAKEVVQALISETLRFRDKLLRDTGTTLTVADTQAALAALELALSGEALSRELTAEQKALTQLYLDRLTLFGVG